MPIKIDELRPLDNGDGATRLDPDVNGVGQVAFDPGLTDPGLVEKPGFDLPTVDLEDRHTGVQTAPASNIGLRQPPINVDDDVLEGEIGLVGPTETDQLSPHDPQAAQQEDEDEQPPAPRPSRTRSC